MSYLECDLIALRIRAALLYQQAFTMPLLTGTELSRVLASLRKLSGDA